MPKGYWTGKTGKDAPNYQHGMALEAKNRTGYYTGNLFYTANTVEAKRMAENKYADLNLSKEEMLALDYGEKVTLLDAVVAELLSTRIEFLEVSAKHARMKANVQVLNMVKSSLQSSIRAEGG